MTFLGRALRPAFAAASGAATLAAGLALGDEAPLVEADVALGEVRIAALLHTRLSIDEIDAAIAAGARKGEALSRQLSAEGLANIPSGPKPMLADTDLPAAWACRVQLTACIASGDGRHSERERSCNKGFEAESVACGKSAVGETEAERIRHFENCRDIGNLTRRACIKRSESTRSKEAVLCRSTHNCDPLPNAAAVPGAADCGGADRSGGEESSRASQSCLQPVRPLATAP